MTVTPPFDAPPHWARPFDAEFRFARQVAIEALDDAGDRPATGRLAQHYDPDGRGAGTTFLDLSPVDVGTITATDLHALTVLDSGVDALTTRRLLGDETLRQSIEHALESVPVDVDLASASTAVLGAMDTLADAVLAACRRPAARASNPWVTTAKLCSRKRPRLFPVRDRVVCRGLGLFGTPDRRVGDRRIDWQVFAGLMGDNTVRERLDEVTVQVEGMGVRCDPIPLRVLDVALWTHLRRR